MVPDIKLVLTVLAAYKSAKRGVVSWSCVWYKGILLTLGNRVRQSDRETQKRLTVIAESLLGMASFCNNPNHTTVSDQVFPCFRYGIFVLSRIRRGRRN